ncbi:hypothetical protein [Listeria valentina]|uniref:hypothetical protein n=1 Tax=Listeria valentina TaxID=2705293 RepID=UPI001431D9C3|nr:hypothetical protein [Listeria valentina]
METFETMKEISNTLQAGLDQFKNIEGVNIKKDNLVIIQQYNDNQMIVVSIKDDENGERGTNVEVVSAGILLPKKDGVLDIYEEGS